MTRTGEQIRHRVAEGKHTPAGREHGPSTMIIDGTIQRLQRMWLAGDLAELPVLA